MGRYQWRDQNEDPAISEYFGSLAATPDNGPSLTQQQFAEDADLNVIMRRYGVTDGAIPPAWDAPGDYVDFTNVPDFRTALDIVHRAKEKFAALPAELRKRFNNNPAQLHDWVMDEANLDEARKLGLIAPPKPSTTPATGAPETSTTA